MGNSFDLNSINLPMVEKKVYEVSTKAFGDLQMPLPPADKPFYLLNLTKEYQLELFYTATCPFKSEQPQRRVKAVYASPVIEHLQNCSIFDPDEIITSSEKWVFSYYEAYNLYLVSLQISGEYEKQTKHLVYAVNKEEAANKAAHEEAHNRIYPTSSGGFEEDDGLFVYKAISVNEITDPTEIKILTKHLRPSSSIRAVE